MADNNNNNAENNNNLQALAAALEEDDEDEDDDDEEDDDESDDENRDGVLDGGVAEPQEAGKPRRTASQADIVLFFVCTEILPFCPNHPILKVGVTVQIGMGKASKLNAVFRRYVEFCNEHYPSVSIDLNDLEFVYVQVLDGNDTAENAALMKNDRISVRREQADKRRFDETKSRFQRDSDKEYFAQLAHLLPTAATDAELARLMHKCADVELVCHGSLPQVEGQPWFHAPGVIKCQSALIRRRCPWLGAKIAEARRERSRRSVVTLPDETKESEDEEDFDMLQQMKRREPAQNDDSSFAAQIENDDEENSKNPSVLSVFIEKHPPEAVKILLEYIYTNRVVPLGFEAFMQSCKTKLLGKKMLGPVAPFAYRSSRWPLSGAPQVSFAVALAGIQLSEEANIKRLSFMCEIAASQLVGKDTVVDALTACEDTRKKTGNSLPNLRAAAMEIVLGNRLTVFHGGVMKTVLSDALRSDKGSELVPTLLKGAMEAIAALEEKKKLGSLSSHISHHHHHTSGTLNSLLEKRDWQTMAFSNFDWYDRDDATQRERERKRHRRNNSSNGRSIDLVDYDEDDDEEMFDRCAGRSRQMSLRRMSHHLEGRLGLILRDGDGLTRRGH